MLTLCVIVSQGLEHSISNGGYFGSFGVPLRSLLEMLKRQAFGNGVGEKMESRIYKEIE
jgi:hypothetical protein